MSAAAPPSASAAAAAPAASPVPAPLSSTLSSTLSSPPSDRKQWTTADIGRADPKELREAKAAASNAANTDGSEGGESFSYTTGISQAPKFQSRTTTACYGAFYHASADDLRAVDVRPARFLSPKKNEVGNSVTISQVNAVPAGASSATAALQKSSGLAFSGGAKGALRTTGPRQLQSGAEKLESFTRVNPSHMVKWANAQKTEQQMNYVNHFQSPEFAPADHRHVLKVVDRVYKVNHLLCSLTARTLCAVQPAHWVVH
jgi:hypothetical protein